MYDLLYHYLVTNQGMPLGQQFRTRWKNWEKAWSDRVDPPTQPPADRNHVYQLLVSSPEGQPANTQLSRIPWNQLGYGWQTALGPAKSSKSCSEVLRFFFDRYMKLDSPSRYSLLKHNGNDFDKTRVERACDMLAERLRQNNPTSIAICWPTTSNRSQRLDPEYIKQNGWPHVLGIVACDSSKRKFLALEPWPGNATGADYRSCRTSFLAEIQFNAAKGVLEYTNGVSAVKGSCVLVVNAF
ncbi:hypothetical protein FBQ97_06235 [Acidobacteria bacterium ACD]|nr:MAG: hypothetical protein EDX89_07175 [Acidobacteriota bacterium]MCE7957291.1 hypothetical protein [Acidobacteria bacterium ACB2]MDL1949398.1 hypothetical protein [Acidobacteria bacterium ACD]